jgi:threonine dehydratase
MATTTSPTLADLEGAAEIVYRAMPPTPQHRWPLLCERLGAEVWVKHENHTPTGAFKVRGGLVYLERLRRAEPDCPGVISATRGNHGQSLGFAARRHGLPATVVVPHGNSVEKNAAMSALGVELVVHGDDFQEARLHAAQLAGQRGMHMIPAFHPWLVDGVASYGLELLRAVPTLEIVYVPVGQGSGVNAVLAARTALGHGVTVVGVVSAHAPAYARSFEARTAIEAPTTTALADGLACRVSDAEALDGILAGVDHIVEVTDADVAGAMRALFADTHNTAEGAGAAALAAAVKDRAWIAGRSVAVVQTGGNVDTDVFASVLSGTVRVQG